MQPHTSYLVCGTPRSGSSLLCEALTNTGVAGLPEEYFLPQNERKWQAHWGTSTYADYLAHTIKQCTTPNGVFGVKMMWGYFGSFLSKARQVPTYRYPALSDHALVQRIFPHLHYIWITRRDKVRQAVSHAKARQTDIWAVRAETDNKPIAKPLFSFEQIDYMVQELEAHEAAWQKYFTLNDIQPYTIVYEDFVEKYSATTIDLLKYIGIPPTQYSEPVQGGMRKQADQESEQWVERYLHLKSRSKRHRLVSYRNALLVMVLQNTRSPGSVITKYSTTSSPFSRRQN